MPTRETQIESSTRVLAHHLHSKAIDSYDVADFLDITYGEAADYIAGRVPWPLDLMHRLVTHIGLSPEELFHE